MEHIIAPSKYDGYWEHTLFLAGGISDCPDWQSEVVDRLRGTDLKIFNPRRVVFLPSDQDEQDVWEFEHLNRCGAILFWFPKEGPAGATLFEYGTWVQSGLYQEFEKKIFVGIHPQYRHRNYLVNQARLKFPNFSIHDSLSSLVETVLYAARFQDL